MQFRARAVDAEQGIQELMLVALDEAEARAQLAARALVPLSLRAVSGWGGLGRRDPAFPLTLFAEQLQALVAAGLGVPEALEALVEREAAPEVAAVLTRLQADVRSGLKLSQALKRQPQAFSSLFAGLVQSAEGTSDLPEALGRYIAHQGRLEGLAQKLKSAAIYPAVLLAVGATVALFLLTYVVPRFAGIYEGGMERLPWGSRLLLQAGAWLGQHALATVAAVLALGGLVVAALRRRWRERGIAGVLGWVPAWSQKLAQFELARLYLTLGTLLAGGIALPAALRMAGEVLPPARRAALDGARAEVEAGQPLSQALAAAGLDTPVAQRLVRVGERSGGLAEMLQRAAVFHELETARFIERASRVFEPVLMAAIGLVIGLIVILLYMPVFELAGSLHG